MIPATINPTLSKLVALLGSNQDGEVLAVASAIGQVLAANGRDFNDLAQVLSPTTAGAEDWHDQLAFCALHAGRLNDKERDFLGTLARWKGKPTEKQRDWLDGIAAKLKGGKP